MAVVAVAAAVGPTSAECHTAVSIEAEWARAVPVIAARTGTAAVRTGTGPRGTAGTAPTGVAVIGAAAITGAAVVGIIIGEITTADGVGGTVTGGVFRGTTLCSLAVLASHGGGVGAGALGQAGAGAAATVTTAVILTTAAAMALPIMAMAMETDMDTATDMVPRCSTEGTETAANPESPSCNSGCHAPVITTGPSTESWVRRREPRSAHTSKSTVT